MTARAICAFASTWAVVFGVIAPVPDVRAQNADADTLIVDKTSNNSAPSSKKQTTKLDLPLKYNGAYVADVTVAIDADRRISIDSKSLARSLSRFLTAAAVAAITRETAKSDGGTPAQDGVTEAFKKKPGEEKSVLLVRLFERAGVQEKAAETHPESVSETGAAGEFLTLAEVTARGLDIAYDVQSSELIVKPSVEQLRESSLSLGEASVRAESSTLQAPAYFSAYLTMRMNADYVHTAAQNGTGLQAPNFALESAARIGAVVVEGEATLTAFSGRPATSGDALYEFARHGTRIVYDWPEEVLRVKAGDVTPAAGGFDTSSDLLGVSIERSYKQLKPGQNIQPTGNQSFRIDRTSNVDILADGLIVRRLRLAPGNYNLRDLPLNAGATKITLAIEDDTGLRCTLEFNMFSGASLLSQGLDEWQFAGGIRAGRGLDAVNRKTGAPVTYSDAIYLFDQPMISAFYRTGLTPSKTIGLSLQADERTAAGGASLLTATPAGFITVDFGASVSADFGAGWAVHALYELSNLKRDNGLNHSLALTTEYRSAGFASDSYTSSSRSDQGVKLGFLYSRAITEDFGASLNLSVTSAPYALSEIQRWDADFALTDRLTDTMSGALSVGYGEGATGETRGPPCVCDNTLQGRGLRALLRLNYRPDQASYVSLDADAALKTARLSATRSEGSGLGAWTASVDTGYDASGKSADVNAAASVSWNRADISVAHAVRTDLFPAKGRDANPLDERSSIRVETSVAAADGVWSFGRPVHNSFAIIEPHETLGDRKVTAGLKDSEISKSDSFGPALVSDISPYVQRRLPYDVEDLPIGYDLGAGAFDLNGPYKAGYRLKAGSDYAITALGTLLDHNGQPLALLQGTAREDGKTNGPAADVFTNKTGHFGAQGLGPGRWIIEIASEPEPTRFVLTIPSSATGLFQAGALKPL